MRPKKGRLPASCAPDSPVISPLYRRCFPFLLLASRGAVRILVPRFRVTGRQHIPHRGPVIFAANHISDFDPPLLGVALRFPLVWMAKRELWQYAWLAPLLDFFGAFPVDPASPDRAALRMAATALEHGEGLGLFPEGLIAPDGRLGPILPGAVQLALKSGATVVPVGIYGTQNVIPYGTTLPRLTLAKVHVHFGVPLCFDDLEAMTSREARITATRRLETAIRAASETART